MFPNSNPFPLSPPPEHILFYHHHHQYNHRDLLLQPPPAPPNFETNFHPRPNTKKVDRHSKIYTAQGPRDRRVRLSIGIARKFFDLQDTLGFDKASQTLDWLLKKSKFAIKDLVQSKLGCTKNVYTSLSSIYMSDDEEVDLSVIEELERISCKEKKSRSKQSTAADLAVKESRARARARARERTREKMRVRNEMKKSGPSISHQNGGNRIGQWALSSVPVVLNWEIGTTNLPRFVNQSTDNWDFGKPWDVYNNHIS